MSDSVREDDHHSFDRDDLDLDVEEAGDESRPGTGRVDHRLAPDARLLAGDGVAGEHPGDAIVGLEKAGDLGVGPDLSAAAPRRLDVAHHQVEGVQMAIFVNPEDGADMLGEGRLAPAGLLDRDPLAGDSRFGAALDETRFPGKVFLGDRNEVSTGVLDGGLRDAPEDAALLHALDRGGRVVDAVASAGVKPAVGP